MLQYLNQLHSNLLPYQHLGLLPYQHLNLLPVQVPVKVMLGVLVEELIQHLNLLPVQVPVKVMLGVLVEILINKSHELTLTSLQSVNHLILLPQQQLMEV